ncbi:MAG: VOC family protein [Dehalococcoidia bacterium]
MAEQRITPFLWFNNQAEEAMHHYVSIFEHAKIESVTRYEEGPLKGRVLTGVFELEGQRFMALDGGPEFNFTEAISFQINCETQEEVDHLWEKLSEGGDKGAQQCGWLKDKFGVSWQVVPTVVPELLNDPDPDRSQRVMQALLQMKKLDIAKLKDAYAGR